MTVRKCDIPTLGDLREKLLMGERTEPRCKEFCKDVREFLDHFTSSKGTLGADMRKWVRQRDELLEMTEEFLVRQKMGEKYWPSDRSSPNFCNLVFREKPRLIRGLVMQNFFKVNVFKSDNDSRKKGKQKRVEESDRSDESDDDSDIDTHDSTMGNGPRRSTDSYSEARSGESSNRRSFWSPAYGRHDPHQKRRSWSASASANEVDHTSGSDGDFNPPKRAKRQQKTPDATRLSSESHGSSTRSTRQSNRTRLSTFSSNVGSDRVMTSELSELSDVPENFGDIDREKDERDDDAFEQWKTEGVDGDTAGLLRATRTHDAGVSGSSQQVPRENIAGSVLAETIHVIQDDEPGSTPKSLYVEPLGNDDDSSSQVLKSPNDRSYSAKKPEEAKMHTPEATATPTPAAPNVLLAPFTPSLSLRQESARIPDPPPATTVKKPEEAKMHETDATTTSAPVAPTVPLAPFTASLSIRRESEKIPDPSSTPTVKSPIFGIHYMVTVSKSRTLEMTTWTPQGSFKDKTWEQLKDELPIALNDNSDGLLFILTAPDFRGQDLRLKFHVKGQDDFGRAKRKIYELAKEARKDARSRNKENVEFELGIEQVGNVLSSTGGREEDEEDGEDDLDF